MSCSEKIKQLSKQVETDEKKIIRHLNKGVEHNNYELKKLVKANLNNKIERYILLQLEESESLGWRDINS